MKVLVTGGAGYIGSVAVDALIRNGHEALIYDNLSTGSINRVNDQATFVEADLSDIEQLTSILKDFEADTVFHCAGISAIGDSLTSPGRYYHSLVGAGVSLLDAMVKANCKKLVSCSSYAVYGLPEKMPVDERVPTKPITPGGHAFLTFEQIIEWYHKIYDLQYTTLRVFSAAGATESRGEINLRQDRLISRILAVVGGHEDYVPVFGDDHVTPDGTCIRDFVHVQDVASAMLSAMDSDRSGVFNIGSGEGQSIMQVLDCARRETGHDIPIRMMAKRQGDPPRLVAAYHRAKMEWKWQPEFQRFKDIFATSWKWVQSHPEYFKPKDA